MKAQFPISFRPNFARFDRFRFNNRKFDSRETPCILLESKIKGPFSICLNDEKKEFAKGASPLHTHSHMLAAHYRTKWNNAAFVLLLLSPFTTDISLHLNRISVTPISHQGGRTVFLIIVIQRISYVWITANKALCRAQFVFIYSVEKANKSKWGAGEC